MINTQSYFLVLLNDFALVGDRVASFLTGTDRIVEGNMSHAAKTVTLVFKGSSKGFLSKKYNTQ